LVPPPDSFSSSFWDDFVFVEHERWCGLCSGADADADV
jgi:hypothetical protein